MELVVGAAEAQGWTGARVDQELVGIIRPKDEVEVVRLNEDPTLRLVPDQPLARPCVGELVYDRDGQEEMPVPPGDRRRTPCPRSR